MKTIHTHCPDRRKADKNKFTCEFFDIGVACNKKNCPNRETVTWTHHQTIKSERHDVAGRGCGRRKSTQMCGQCGKEKFPCNLCATRYEGAPICKMCWHKLTGL